MSQTPTIGRIVLFQNWRRLEAPALIIGVQESGALNLQVFNQDGTLAHVTGVPGWQADDKAIETSRVGWADWDAYCDEVRADGGTIEGSSPQTPQQSWRWPPRADTAESNKPIVTGSMYPGAQTQQEKELARLASLDQAEANGRRWFEAGNTLDDRVPAAQIPDDGHMIAFARGFEAAKGASGIAGGSGAGSDAPAATTDAAGGQFDKPDGNGA